MLFQIEDVPEPDPETEEDVPDPKTGKDDPDLDHGIAIVIVIAIQKNPAKQRSMKLQLQRLLRKKKKKLIKSLQKKSLQRFRRLNLK